MQRGGLSYADTASLIGVGVETLRTWLNASNSRRAQDRHVKTLNWLIDHQFHFPSQQYDHGSLLAQLHAMRTAEARDKLTALYTERTRDDLNVFLDKLGLATVNATINGAMEVAAQLLKVSSFLTLAQMLRLVPVPAEPVAYEFQTDSSMVALLTGYGKFTEIRFVRASKLPAHVRIDPVPVKFEFRPSALMSASDNGSAQRGIEQCVSASAPWALDSAYGEIAEIAVQARDSVESLLRPVVYQVLVAHALVNLAGVSPDQTA